MSIAEKLTAIAENEQKVYDAGKDAGRTAVFNGFQDYGKRTNYERAFARWNVDGIRPAYDINATHCQYMFYNIASGSACDLTARLVECGVTLDTSKCTAFEWAFYAATKITRVPVISTVSAAKVDYVFLYSSIETIDKLVLKDDGTQTFTEVFTACSVLKNLVVEGVIGQDGFNVATCPELTHDSLASILNALKDYSGTDTTKTVTIGATNKAKMTADELYAAANKGWTVK